MLVAVVRVIGDGTGPVELMFYGRAHTEDRLEIRLRLAAQLQLRLFRRQLFRKGFGGFAVFKILLSFADGNVRIGDVIHQTVHRAAIDDVERQQVQVPVRVER